MKKLGLISTLSLGLILLAGCNISKENMKYDQNSWKNIIDEDCMLFFDGCNECSRLENGEITCTTMFCEAYQEPICTDDSGIIPGENIEEEIVEEETEEEVIDGEKWSLLAFNGKEVDGDYSMTITNDGKLYTKFCNGMGGDVNFDGDGNEGTISASLVQNLMLCEGESMDLENAFQIDGANYTKITNEDGGKTMIITTINGDKFNWRTNSL